MNRRSKVIPVLSGALTLGGISSRVLASEPARAPEERQGERTEGQEASTVQGSSKEKAKSKAQVEKAPQEKRRPADSGERFSMPAGTLYDVLGRRDLD